MSKERWPTQAELKEFRQMREVGLLTFFRTARCAGCGGEIPKGKGYCSRSCWVLAVVNDVKSAFEAKRRKAR